MENSLKYFDMIMTKRAEIDLPDLPFDPQMGSAVAGSIGGLSALGAARGMIKNRRAANEANPYRKDMQKALKNKQYTELGIQTSNLAGHYDAQAAKQQVEALQRNVQAAINQGDPTKIKAATDALTAHIDAANKPVTTAATAAKEVATQAPKRLGRAGKLGLIGAGLAGAGALGYGAWKEYNKPEPEPESPFASAFKNPMVTTGLGALLGAGVGGFAANKLSPDNPNAGLAGILGGAALGAGAGYMAPKLFDNSPAEKQSNATRYLNHILKTAGYQTDDWEGTTSDFLLDNPEYPLIGGALAGAGLGVGAGHLLRNIKPQLIGGAVGGAAGLGLSVAGLAVLKNALEAQAQADEAARKVNLSQY